MTRVRGPLTESEKQWKQHFTRRARSLQGADSVHTAFLDPLQQELAEAVLREETGLSYTSYGGYSGAERVCLHIFPAGMQGALPGLSCLLIRGNFDKSTPTHRDYLGALLGLGLRRDQVGDIIMMPDGGAAVMVVRAQADLICNELVAVGNLPVECTLIDPSSLEPPGEDGREISGTVASLRLDAVLSLGFGISRSRAAILIKGDRVKVNWRPADSPSFQLRTGDLISLQGRGRLELLSLSGETRKGRQRVKMKKFN